MLAAVPVCVIREPLPMKKSIKNRYYLYLAICLYAFELFLAGIFNGSWVARVPLLQTFTRLMESAIPMIGFYDKVALHPEGLRVYLSMTWLLLPFKIFFWYKWLMGDEVRNYRHFIISPYARQKNISNLDFIQDAIPNRKENKPIKQRSLFATAVWSIMILLFVCLALFASAMLGPEAFDGVSTGLRSRDVIMGLIALGGVYAWVVWSVLCLSCVASVVAAGFCVIRDWYKFRG